MSHRITQDKFLGDVQHHQMTVLRDDGLYRHLRFKRPETICESFDLITYPGGLLYRGDMGAFCFERTADMFAFFSADCGLINPRYWSQKLVGVDRSQNPVEEFSEETFDQKIKEIVLRWVRDNEYHTTREQRRELWDTVLEEVIGADSDSGGDRKQIAANDFSHQIYPGQKFYFTDIWEYDFTEYTYRFLWCCYALVWGIKQYDAAKLAGSAK